MFFKQLKQFGDNFSYIIADETTKEAAVVDASFNAPSLIRIVKAEGFTLKYIINTHGHSDHTAGNQELQKALGGQIVAYRLARSNFNLAVDDGETLKVGEIPLKVIYTPGHTLDSICVLVNGKTLLTGDTLFVGECGRTDLPGGDPEKMYKSLFGKLLKLSDEVEIYPGHNYGSEPFSTVGQERLTNYTLKPRSLEQFVEFMREP
jgi:hydroxyacylglutathione hydrolase